MFLTKKYYKSHLVQDGSRNFVSIPSHSTVLHGIFIVIGDFVLAMLEQESAMWANRTHEEDDYMKRKRHC